MYKKIFNRLILILLFLNCYLCISLFFGKNSIINYLDYKKQIKTKNLLLNSIIHERDQIEKISELLKTPDKNIDVLEELLRQTLQVSKENEVLILD